jgi:hypothetical protein
MRTSNFLPLAVALLVGCDQRGTSPTAYTGIDTKMGATGTSAGGTGDSTGGGSDSSSSILDTVQLNGPLASNQLVGGQRRSLVLYYPADRQLHILASSDGAVSGTYDRETVWDVTVSSANEIYPSRTTAAENGFRDTIWLDTATYRYAKVRLYTDVAATEVKFQSDPGAILSVTVTAYSQIIPNATVAGIFPSQLSAAATGALIYAGPSTSPIGKTSFFVRLPAY